MASKENADLDPTSTGTGDETVVAARKERLRRVSFADVEITSIHIFKRDEDFSDSTPPSDPKPDEKLPERDRLVIFSDLGDHNDDYKELGRDREDGEEEEEGLVGRVSFFRPMESPSPGSSTVGSAFSNNEDNFFGPVEPGFIRPGRLSDSAASDDNHDITMDSTAFSMHYRSLARSESGDLKTPSRTGLSLEEKTLTQDTMETNGGMIMIYAGKLPLESSLPRDNSRSDGKYSNAMSLVGETTHKYDYGRISPSLDALLAEGSENLHQSSLSHLADLKSNANGQEDLMDFGDEEIGRTTRDTNQITEAHGDVQEANNYSDIMPMQHVMKDVSNRHDWSAIAPVYKSMSTPEQPVNGNKLLKTEVEVDGLNIGFSSITRGTPRSNGTRFLDLDVTRSGSTDGRLSEEYIQENSPRSKSLSVKSDRMMGSPLAGSISSISAKRCEIFLSAAPPANFLNFTPSPAQTAISSCKESAKHGLNFSSIQESISKFSSLDSSPKTSALKDGIETLKLKISNYLSANSPHNTARVESSIDLPSKGVNAPIAHLEHLADDPMAVKDESMPVLHSNGVLNPHNIETVRSLGQNEEITLATKLGEPHDDLHTSISHDKLARDATAMTLSPHKFYSRDPASANLTKRALHASKVSSPLMNETLDHRKDDGDACIASGLLISPTGKKYQRGGNDLLNQQYQFNEFSGVNCEENETSRGMTTCGGHLTPNTNKLQSFSLFEGANQKLSTQGGSTVDLYPLHQLNKFTGVNAEENQTSSETVTSVGFPNPDKLQSVPSSMIARDGGNLDFLPVTTFKELPSVNNGANFESDVSRLVGDASLVSTSVVSHGRTDKSPLQKSPLKKPIESPRMLKLTQSPCLRELSNSLPADNVHFRPEEEIVSSPSKLSCVDRVDCQKESNHAERSFPPDDCKESSCGKRSRQEAALGDEYFISKTSRTERSLEAEKGDRHDFASYSGFSNEREKPGAGVSLMDWKEVLTKFSQDTEKMLCPLSDRLDIRGISMLGGTLDYLQKVRSYDLLSSEIQSKSSTASHKRSAETLLLLQKLVYEKAQLQINLARLDRLQRVAEKLSSGIEESQKLKRIYRESVSLPVQGGIQHDHDCQVCSANSKLKKTANDTAISMRQENEVLDERVRSLSNSLLAFCKINGELSCTSDMASLTDSLKKKIRRRLIHQHLQSWEVAQFESSNGHHNIRLNYLGFIHQSVLVTAHPIHSITVSNKLQDLNINKTFPNMDACAAFAYVFSDEITKKLVRSRSLAQETQATGSRLRNLLEVVEEVQQARLEIKNLICTTFHSPSGGQLDLLLSFIDLNKYQKMTITLDMRCLNRGIYPSQVLPDQVKAVTKGMPQSLAMEVRAAARSLPSGYQRIMRLCSCISKLSWCKVQGVEPWRATEKTVP